MQFAGGDRLPAEHCSEHGAMSYGTDFAFEILMIPALTESFGCAEQVSEREIY